MNFTPISKQEISEMNLLDEGTYNFIVESADERQSKFDDGTYINLVIKVWDKDNKERVIYDNLTVKGIGKIQSFCESTGLLDKYDAGNLVAGDCVTKSGVLKLGKMPAKGEYPAKNTVRTYMSSKEEQASVTADITPDDIPF